MSLEVLLIPLGIAAYAAWRESSSTDLCEKCKSTRITDQRLLVNAVESLGASSIVVGDGRVTGRIAANTFTFQQVGDIYLGRIDGADEAVTLDFLTHLEARVGHIVQAENVEVIRRRAQEMGMVLLEQRNADGSVQLVFEEARA
jgi:hypothetical protein